MSKFGEENILCSIYIFFCFKIISTKIFRSIELLQEVPASKTSKHSEPIKNDQLIHVPDHPDNQQESAETDQRNQCHFLHYSNSATCGKFDGYIDYMKFNLRLTNLSVWLEISN